MENKSPLLEVKNLSAGYKGTGRKAVIKNINFDVKEGEILGIVGESGSGKSTLIKAMMQIKGIDARILEGTVKFMGEDFSAFSGREKRNLYGKDISVIFQNPVSTFNPIRKIGTQFLEALRVHSTEPDSVLIERIEKVLISLDLTDTDRILQSYPFQLSGGMGQRVAIAFAVIGNPKLILADEPTSALDVSVQKQAVEEMVKMRDQYGRAIIMITHNMGVVSNMADNIAVMYKGEFVEYGKTRDVLDNPKHSYTKSLINVIPKLGGELPKAGDLYG